MPPTAPRPRPAAPGAPARPPRRRERRAALAGAATALVLLAPAAAHAAKVQGPGPWQATNAYLVTADLDGRALPQPQPIAAVDHVRQGQWVRIECQVKGQAAYGSRIWSKVRGLYVPDKYLKTYTDGFIPGVPRCSVGAPPPAAPAPPPPAPPAPAGPTRKELRRAVKRVAYERVYGSNYRLMKEQYPQGSGIDWDKNGCSVPKALLEAQVGVGPWLRGNPIAFYADLFVKSCDRHDFGYRNYGSNNPSGLKLDPTERRRASIDERFGNNMHYQCQKVFDRKYVELLQRRACYEAADAFETAVGVGARDHFF
ncbi:phospholipase A2 [Patulibacter sp. SYSU D01012]|uniref:phospholipase A2 n=1 Tax=Patulibacter sp. SYSU D01012 TaxID=2817381 RepID=UPI001B30386F|nr:phospholipase A2 [Patulibacter sp. SYSU D01012]